MTPASLAALHALRDSSHFEWAVVVELAFVVSVYASAARRGAWDRIALGIGFWALEFLWEMFNGLVLHFSQFSALWTVARDSAFVIYVGLTIEIAFMFAVAPLIVLDVLPEDREHRVAGLPTRLVVPIAFGLFCVGVEAVLDRWGALVWAWWFWRWPQLWLVALVYCGPFVALVQVHDRVGARTKAIGAGVLVGAAVLAHLVLAVGLRWI
jgi:hypothetical protein